MFKFVFSLILIFFTLNTTIVFANPGCAFQGVSVQVLGSGGPELDDSRASTGYLVWYKAKARILVDMGSGSLYQFEKTGASLNDINTILLSHLHVDHSSDLPAFIMASYFSDRSRDINLFGPTGNELMPSTVKFVQALFGSKGAYKYLNSYLDGSDSYRLVPHNITATGKTQQLADSGSISQLTAVPVHHGPIPALAWRIKIADKTIVFSGDMNNDKHTLAGLAKNADLLVAHHAIPEDAGGVARNLHMPPSVIGKIAARARVKKLVLSHRMKRTMGREKESLYQINKHYKGPVKFADDLQCFRL